MKVKIEITGQISGNFTLLRKLNNGNYTNGMFNSKTISFDTKTEAKKAKKYIKQKGNKNNY